MPSLRRRPSARASWRAARAAHAALGGGGGLAGGGVGLVGAGLLVLGGLEALVELGVVGVQVLDPGAEFLVLLLR